MLVSDFHIKDIDSKVLAGFDVLNNYCVNNGINLILGKSGTGKSVLIKKIIYLSNLIKHQKTPKSLKS